VLMTMFRISARIKVDDSWYLLFFYPLKYFVVYYASVGGRYQVEILQRRLMLKKSDARADDNFSVFFLSLVLNKSWSPHINYT